MTPLGMISEDEAQQFVIVHPTAQLGSKSRDGRRRIVTEATGDEFRSLQIAFSFFATASIVEHAETANEQCTPCQQAAIGNRLAEIMKEKRPDDVPCDECLAEIERLNQMTPEQVVEQAKEIALRIVERASTQAASPIDRLVSKYLPTFPQAIVARWIKEAAAAALQEQQASSALLPDDASL